MQFLKISELNVVTGGVDDAVMRGGEEETSPVSQVAFQRPTHPMDPPALDGLSWDGYTP